MPDSPRGDEGVGDDLSPDRHQADPSTLLLLWSEDSPPLGEELRLALQRDFPSIAPVDDLETSDEVPWGGAFSIEDEGAEFSIWIERRGELGEDLLRRDLEDDTEFDAARKAKWLVGCEMFLRPERPLHDLRLQFRILSSVALPGLHAVYDDNAVVVHSGRLFESLAHAEEGLPAAALFALHDTPGDGHFWVHTHGLHRAGLPEVDLLKVPESAVEGAHEVIALAVDALLSGARPASDGTFPIAPGFQVRALPLQVALAGFPPDVAGGARDREGDDAGDHAGLHLVLLEARRFRSPVRLLKAVRDRAVWRPRGMAHWKAALSLRHFGVFGQAFTIMRGQGWRFFAKFGFGGGPDPSFREHLWFEVSGLRRGEIKGRLVTAPHRKRRDVPTSDTWLPLADLSEWRVAALGREYGPEEAAHLIATLDL